MLDDGTDLSFKLRQPFCMEEYHWHQQVEVNVIYKETVEYTFNNANIHIKAGEMVLFWAAPQVQ